MRRRVHRMASEVWALGLLFCVAHFSAPAATVIWDGGGTNAFWSTVLNWSTDALPASGDIVQFSSGLGSGSAINLNGNRTAASLTINTLSSFSLTNSTLTLSTGDITRNDIAGTEADQTITSGIALGADGVWTIDGSGSLISSGVVSGGHKLTKAGAGTLILSGANTFSHDMTLSAGTLALGHNTAAGTASLILNGGTVQAYGAARTIDNDLTLGGDFSIGGSLDLTFTGAAALSADRIVTVDNTGDTTFSGVISGGFAMTKAGAGTLTLSGGSANTFSGAMTVNDGTLELNKTATKNAYAGTLTVGDGSGAANSAVTRWLAANQAPATTISVNSDGLADLNGYSDAVGGLNMTGGSITTGNGTLTLGGNVTGNASANTATISGNLALGANRTFTIADGAAAEDMNVSAVVSGAFNVTKNGTGTLVFSSANNSFSGTTTVNAGDFSINTFTIGTASTVSIASGATYTSTGTLNLNPSTSGAQTFISGAGTLRLRNPSSTLSAPDIYYDPNGGIGDGYPVTIASAIDVGTGTRIINGKADRNDFGDYGGELTLAGNLTGSANLTFAGTVHTNVSGTYLVSYVLGGNNSAFTGGVTLSGGANLILSNTVALSAANTVAFNPGATEISALYLFGRNVTIGELSGTSAGTMRIRNGSHTADTSSRIIKANATLTVQQDTDSTFNGIISDGPNDDGDGDAATYYTLGLTKAGSGTLTLGGANTYNGATTVSAGALSIQNATALGSTTAGTTVSSGAALQLLGGIAVGAEALTLNGSGISSGGALRNVSGNNSWAGAVTLGSASTIASDSGTLTVGGTIANGGFTSTFSGAGNVTANGVISGTGGLTKSGAGTLTLSAAQTFTGTLNVNGGTLLLGSADRIADTVNVTMSGGKFSSGGYNETVGTLTLTADSVIDFGSGASVIHFASSAATSWTAGTVLTITNWSGPYGGGGSDQLFFGSAITGLSGSQLAQIQFVDNAGHRQLANILSNGEIVPIPEPATVFGVILMGAGLAYRERRNVRKLFSFWCESDRMSSQPNQPGRGSPWRVSQLLKLRGLRSLTPLSHVESQIPINSLRERGSPYKARSRK